MPTTTKKVSEKKAPAKKKKVIAKKSEVKPITRIIQRFEKRFFFVPVCDNCDHVPMRVNRLVALMSVLVIVLSGIVIAQSQPVLIQEILAATSQLTI